MKRYIRSAEDSAPSKEDMLNDILTKVKDNFNFAIDGIEKIASDGDVDSAMKHATTLNEMIDGAVGEIAEDISIAD